MQPFDSLEGMFDGWYDKGYFIWALIVLIIIFIYSIFKLVMRLIL